MEVMGMATPSIAGVVAGYEAADGGVTLGMGAGASGTIMVRSVTVGAAAAEGRVGEGVLDAPPVFKPGPEGFAVS
jgi:hypothetical protein